MRKHKRDINIRAYQRGYRIGLTGRSMELCPHESGEAQFQWVRGWREGRKDQWDGFTGISSIARASNG